MKWMLNDKKCYYNNSAFIIHKEFTGCENVYRIFKKK